jgi:hypothetical protein
MIFNPKNFRVLGGDSVPPSGIRNNAKMTLILVTVNGDAEYAHDRTGKDAIVKRAELDDLLLLAWTGNWKTDIFVLSGDDLAKHYDPKK